MNLKPTHPSITAHPERLHGIHRHVDEVAKLNKAVLKRTIGEVESFNGKVAVLVCAVLGSMAFFWIANILALVSLPAVLTLVVPSLKATFPAFLIKVSLISLVSWIAQTYIQLVALPVLQVSNNAQQKQADENTKVIIGDLAKLRDWVSFETEGGAREILKAIQERNAQSDS